MAGGGPFAPDSSSDCHEYARLSHQTQNNQNHNYCHSLRLNSNRLLRNDSNSPLRHNKSRLLCTNKSLSLHNSSLKSLLAYHRRVTHYGPVNNRTMVVKKAVVVLKRRNETEPTTVAMRRMARKTNRDLSLDNRDVGAVNVDASLVLAYFRDRARVGRKKLHVGQRNGFFASA